MRAGQNAIVPLQKKILFSLWILSKQESYLAVGDRFGVAKSSGHLIFKEIVNILLLMRPQFIQWPNVEKQLISENVSL